MSKSQSPITSQIFIKRLVALCTSGGGRGMPSHPRDLQILLKSMALCFSSSNNYSEKQVNERLKVWLREVGQNVEIDHATLRRYLVDAGYLRRDKAGQIYQLIEGWKKELFDPDVELLLPAVLIEEARQKVLARKQAYLEKQDNS